MISSERLYLTEDGRVVEAGDPDARWLFAAEGAEISDAVAAEHGVGEDRPRLNVDDTLALAETLSPVEVIQLLADEQAKPKPRKTLVAGLEDLIAADEEE